MAEKNNNKNYTMYNENEKTGDRTLVNPQTDIVFKEIFSKNKRALASLISSVIGRKVKAEDITVVPNEITSEGYDGKVARLDIEVLIGNEKYDIEMQICKEKGFYKRSRYYWAKLYTDNFKQGDKYSSLKPTICINIVNFVCFDKPEFVSRYQNVDTLGTEGSEYYVCKEILELDTTYYIELPKVKDIDPETDIELWGKFFNVRKESDLAMLESKNKDLFCGADEDLKGISQDDIKRKAAFKRERAEADYINRYEDGFEDGFEDGIEKERVRNILKLHKYGLGINEISDALSISADEVQRIIDSNKEAKND